MLLEDCQGSQVDVRSQSRHFRVLEEFRTASYSKRYEIMLRRLVLEKMYDGAALVLACRDGSNGGDYREPSDDLSMKRFLASLGGHVRTALASL
jgi:hypothetical protein